MLQRVLNRFSKNKKRNSTKRDEQNIFFYLKKKNRYANNMIKSKINGKNWA